MVEKRMDVRLTDPALEARRQALEVARDHPKLQERQRTQDHSRDVQE